MPNVIDASGLTIKTQAELVAEETAALQTVYGPDVNLAPDTPDGQMMMIRIQSELDNLELIKNVNTQFDPDQANGVILDQRVAINGIQRQVGTYTITDITIVTSRALNLVGLSVLTAATEDLAYTISDNQGNRWFLVTSQTIGGSGTYTVSFRARFPGATLTTPNTITTAVTIVLGVVSVNNPTTYTTLGINEESDFQLKIRRQQSVSLASQGYLSALYAALRNINGITTVVIVENNTDTTDVNGVPSHSIWVIIGGTAADADIAQAIYTKRNAGCGMYGDSSYNITQVDGTEFTVYWDVVVTETIFIQFVATSLDGINPPQIGAIRSALPTSFAPAVNEKVNINSLADLIRDVDSNTLVTSAGFSKTYGGTYTATLTPTTKKNQFVTIEADIMITPMILLPALAQVIAAANYQFAGYGGYGAYTWSITSNISGGSIDASTGLYTAGATPGSDVIRVTDTASNYATATITVVSA